MPALFDATLALAGELGGLYDGQISDDCTTTELVDELLKAKSGSLQYGTLWFKTGDLAEVCLPVDLHSAGKLKFPQQGKAPARGDLYSVLPEKFPLHLLTRSIDQALQNVKKFTQDYHDATFITVAGQQEYTLPSGISNVKKVDVARGTAAPWSWEESLHWRETEGGALRFIQGWQPWLAGYRIWLHYNIKHARLPNLTLDTAKTLRDTDLGDLDASEQAAAWVDYEEADPCALTYVVIVPKADGSSPTLDIKIQLSDDGITSDDEYVMKQITEAGTYYMDFKTAYQYRRYYATVAGAGANFGEVVIVPRSPSLINPGINIDRLKWEAAVNAYRDYLKVLGSTDADDPSPEFVKEARMNAKIAEPHDVKRISRAPILAGW